MKLDSIGEIIASRKLFMKDEPQKEIQVLIGKPALYMGSSDYYCPIQIKGIGDERVEYAVGIDSVQALLLSLKRLEFILIRLNDETGGQLRWEGDEKGNLGFTQL